MVQLGILVPRLASAVELAGVLDGFLDLVFGFDDLEGETHRYVPADVAVHSVNEDVSKEFDEERNGWGKERTYNQAPGLSVSKPITRYPPSFVSGLNGISAVSRRGGLSSLRTTSSL
jgi:hypothetical protein